MGGQACILYGAAEFSRDLDLSISIAPENLSLLKKALRKLKTERVFVPDLDPEALARGHACHFRCHESESEGLRIDLMSKMRMCPDFKTLWERRTIINLPEIGEVGLLSLPDLVQSKKTQQQKDWPMIRRLIEADILQFREHATAIQVRFWFKECRTPSLLIQLASQFPDYCNKVLSLRPLLEFALKSDEKEIEQRLLEEEKEEKEKDRQYWLPLKQELEKWRRDK